MAIYKITTLLFLCLLIPSLIYKKEIYVFNNSFFIAVDSATTSDSNLYDRRTLNTNKTDLKKIRIYDFRHSCASPLINNGANVTLVTKCLEHIKIEETLNTYSYMFSAALDSIVSIMIKI